MLQKKEMVAVLLSVFLLLSCSSKLNNETGLLKISDNHRFFETQNHHPFFWQGDTGWLLFSKLNHKDAQLYLEDRQKKGFNVIQVMVIHSLGETDVYGDPALINHDLSKPNLKVSGNADGNYWQNMDYVIDLAAKHDIYIALVPVWGSVVKSGKVSVAQAKSYATFLANRYKNKSNVIWMNGGDIPGSDSADIWQTIGETIHQICPEQLITFHPRGRTQSSTWFQRADWLSFNCFQSGHRNYLQDTSAGELHYGEDNYKYVISDYAKMPVKPTLDAEPSYENIPQGLHDTTQPKWKSADVRRYAYWSVFAGAAGFTYGDNSVMQFHKSGDAVGAYGATADWKTAINDTGASQMIYLKKLMLSRDYLSRVPDESIVVNQGTKYNYLAATRGKDYVFVYDFTGENFSLNLKNFNYENLKTTWYNPRNGKSQETHHLRNHGIIQFDPPGLTADGNDWVLVIDAV
ncbi:glycoside hydrolase family 140 protein [Arachidicoccus sp.]|uniref:glycoside hydrolase family 140 protein n=1 Tax=Arachidicoccus sp. TaxID=1872624 RepID=UPI003D257E80